jgi:hypothetical protein
MPSDLAAGGNDRGRVESRPNEDPAVFIRTGKRYALGYFVVACCFGAGAVFVGRVLRLVLVIPAVLFLLIAVWCGFFYKVLGSAFKGVQRSSLGKVSEMDSDSPEISPEKQREMMEHLFPRPRNTDEASIANPTNHDEAVEWARSHKVGVPSRSSKRQSVDLRLSPESLPIIAGLLGGTDQELMMTASFALSYNGARLDSDVTPTTDPTFYRVTMPDGTVHTIPVESP